MEKFPALFEAQQSAQEERLRACNRRTARYGLRLSEESIRALSLARAVSLSDSGRVEFGGGILEKLIDAFCDSPYLEQESYAQTLTDLQDAFYYFKNETLDTVSDDDLIAFMKEHFNDDCEGSIEYLTGSLLEDFSRLTREEEL